MDLSLAARVTITLMAGHNKDHTSETIRIDKWLWFARVVKTRVIAQALAVSGHVRINGMRCNSSAKAIRIGDILTIALPSRVRVLKVEDVAERRGPAPEAARLYAEVVASPADSMKVI